MMWFAPTKKCCYAKLLKKNLRVSYFKKGIVKKTALKEFSNPRKGGIIALSLKEKDELIEVVKTMGKSGILLATRRGQAVRFDEINVRLMGRSATGVRGIKLKEKDYVVGMVLATSDDRTLLQ